MMTPLVQSPDPRAVSLDALAGAVPLNVDLDVALSVLANTVCAGLRRRLPGYGTAAPDTLQRRFLNTGGIIERPPRPDHHPTEPAHLLTDSAPGQPARNDHRAMVGRPHPPLPVRLTGLGPDSP
jgi:hypothetical protein